MSRSITVANAVQRGAFPRTAVAVAASLLTTLLFPAGVSAMEIDTGNPDFSIRWDNTVRLNYGIRVESRDDKIGNSAVSDEGTYSFDRGDAIAKRFDLLSELDVVWRKQHGLRVSATAWGDAAYGGRAAAIRIRRWSTSRATPATTTAATPSASTAASRASSWTPSSSARSTSAPCR